MKRSDQNCPVCSKSTYDGRFNYICCSKCLQWLHFKCARVSKTDACVTQNDVPWFCDSCFGNRHIINNITTVNLNQSYTRNQFNKYNYSTDNSNDPKIKELTDKLKEKELEIRKYEDLLTNAGNQYQKLKEKNSVLEKESQQVKVENKQLRKEVMEVSEKISHLQKNDRLYQETKLINDGLREENRRLTKQLNDYEGYYLELKHTDIRRQSDLDNAKKQITSQNVELKCKSYELLKQKTELSSRIALLLDQKKKFIEINRKIQHERDDLEIKNKGFNQYIVKTLELHRAEEEQLEKKHKEDLQFQIHHFELQKNILKLYCRDRDEKLEVLRSILDGISQEK